MRLALHFVAVFSLCFGSLVACNPSEKPSGETTPILETESSYGIEFTLDHLISSVTRNESTHGLAKIEGGHAYQSLMRQYLETCHQVHSGERSLGPLIEELDQTWSTCLLKEKNRQDRLIRTPDRSWKHYFETKVLRKPLYSPAVFEDHQCGHDPEIEILTDAVRRLKTATAQELKFQFNAEGPQTWAYTRMVAPDFFWTTAISKPDFDEEHGGHVSWATATGDDGFWYRQILRKFALAVYQNKFRVSELSSWQELLYSPSNALSFSPASFETLSHTRKHHCSPSNGTSDLDSPICGPKSLSPTSMIVGFNNASLALWLDGPDSSWIPWSTFIELGGHASLHRERTDDASFGFLKTVISKINTLSDYIDLSERGRVDLILSGDAWSEASVIEFEDRLRVSEGDGKITIKNIVYQPDMFAASKRAARWGRYALETYEICYQLIDDPAHDEL